jgi:aspartokinase-like uncharacterized kinase
MTGLPHGSERPEPPGGWQWGVIRSAQDKVDRAAARGGRDMPAFGPSLAVLKVGGSLLARPEWPALVHRLVAARGPGACCLVVGGGAVVDGLRVLDRVVPQTPRLMHALAIDAMRLTARLVAAAVGLPLVAVPPDEGGVAVLDVPAWLDAGSRTGQLPVGWQVTSDSIAACVAVEYGGRLLLAKSVPPPPCPGDIDRVSALAQAGWVDEYFPVAALSLTTIEWAAPQAAA